MRIKGFVEAVAEHEVRGWAFDEDEPDRHVSVVAWLDGTPVGDAVANMLRPDLQAGGIGKGDHEFRITFAHPLRPADLSRLDTQAGRRDDVVTLEILPGSNQSRADSASNPAIPIADPDQHPVFILGPARSGTSALALALLKSGRYEGHGEGHLMPLARELLQTIDTYYAAQRDLTSNDTTLRAIHLSAFQRMVRRGFVQLTRTAFPSGYWIDKTPTAEMVRAAPLMREIWPNARFIFMKRRVIEVIASRRRKFPNDTLENHYLDWTDVMTAWLDVRHRLGDAAIEVEQLMMAHGNEAGAVELCKFLDLSQEQSAALRFALANDHPEQTSSELGKRASLQSLTLSRDDERVLRHTCDDLLEAYGYSYDMEYFA